MATDSKSKGSNDMTPAPNIENGNPASSELRVKSLIVLIDELISVVADENAELAKGLPASRLKQVDEKNRLADLFERCVAECAAKTASLHVQDRVLREELMERIKNAWIVQGAKFGWWHGSEALKLLVQADRHAETRWHIGSKSLAVAQAALAQVSAKQR